MLRAARSATRRGTHSLQMPPADEGDVWRCAEGSSLHTACGHPVARVRHASQRGTQSARRARTVAASASSPNRAQCSSSVPSSGGGGASDELIGGHESAEAPEASSLRADATPARAAAPASPPSAARVEEGTRGGSKPVQLRAAEALATHASGTAPHTPPPSRRCLGRPRPWRTLQISMCSRNCKRAWWRSWSRSSGTPSRPQPLRHGCTSQAAHAHAARCAASGA